MKARMASQPLLDLGMLMGGVVALRISQPRQREPSKRRRANEQLLHQIRIIHSDRHTRCYGSPRMTRELRALGIGCSENRVARIMRSKDLRARPRRPFRPKTTQPDHAAHPSPNLLSEAGSPSAPGAQLVSDISPSKREKSRQNLRTEGRRVTGGKLFHREQRPALKRNIIDTSEWTCANYRYVTGHHFGL